MHVIAVHRVEGELGERAQALAQALGVTAYEARQRLVATPSIVVHTSDAEVAAAREQALAQAGFRVLRLEPETSPFVRLQTVVSSFEWREGAIVARPRQGDPTTLPIDAIRLILRGNEIRSRVHEKEVKTKSFSVGMAVATGGMVMRKTSKKTVRSREDELAGFVHVYATKGRPLIFSEPLVDFTAFGERMQPSRALNLQLLFTELVRAAPQARVDERLTRRSSLAQMLGPGLDPDAQLPLASALLAMSAWS
ncbi:hypothetical protein G6O69_00565 [Pseudenhygromyxa sp. WMMC2535]|uniref:hypothetical protein n=1 Tax=Pseudenhygromyxa sp. WMMC2535 TaxID=2712867 RepID=UPI001552F0AE|nr:hypothetical protein [Pseudenhygromyxa sp. WMMC2535]NVB36303.1 hypothetical protein [Pseudenhygromyxa sp. WMMC2535]